MKKPLKEQRAWPADYGNATLEQVATALLKYRPPKKSSGATKRATN